MTAPTMVRDWDVLALADIVNAERPDVPDEGLPPSLLADLARQIRCDVLAFGRFDTHSIGPVPYSCWRMASESVAMASVPVNWQHYWHCQSCSYPDRTGDLRSIVKISDFYSTRQWPRSAPAAASTDQWGSSMP